MHSYVSPTSIKFTQIFEVIHKMLKEDVTETKPKSTSHWEIVIS